MARLSAGEVGERSDAAWNDTRSWYPLWAECYEYAAPGRNPFFGATTAEGMTAEGEQSSAQETHPEVTDSTVIVAAKRLASRLMSEAFPPGTHFAEFREGPSFALDQADEGARRALLEQMQEDTFAAIDASPFYLSAHQSVFEGVLAGTGLLRIGIGQGPGKLLSVESVPHYEVALEPGGESQVWGFYRKLSLPARMVRYLWPQARWSPSGDESIRTRHNVLEGTYYDPETGVWYYDVLIDRERVWEEDLLVSPWAVWRYSLRPGEVYGRSPVMDALPDVRTANDAVRIQLEAASFRAIGMYQIGSADAVNLQNLDPQPGKLFAVADVTNGIVPLAPAGDVGLNQLVLTDQRESIDRGMMGPQLPPLAGPVRTATEIAARLEAASEAFGEPFRRLLDEFGRPSVRSSTYALARSGRSEALTAASPRAGARVQPLLLDGEDVSLHFTSQLAMVQSLRDARKVVEYYSTGNQTFGPEVMAEVADPVRAGVRLAEMMGVPEGIVYTEQERMDRAQQAAAAPAPAPLQAPAA